MSAAHLMQNAMRVRVLSDLHQEFGATFIQPIDVDLIILAGDISTKQNALQWIRSFCGDTPTAYVCGNHEFYGDKLPRVTERLIEATEGSSIHVLENSHFDVRGWHVYGCTLWTDFALLEAWENSAILAGECMNDYKRVRNSQRGYKKLRPVDTRDIHLKSVALLKDFFTSHDPAKTIVVTHHAPSIQSLPIHRREKKISAAYASNLDAFIQEYQPALWVHGHIHHSNDYNIGKTRVLSNPQAYPEEMNPGFNPELILDIR